MLQVKLCVSSGRMKANLESAVTGGVCVVFIPGSASLLLIAGGQQVKKKLVGGEA